MFSPGQLNENINNLSSDELALQKALEAKNREAALSLLKIPGIKCVDAGKYILNAAMGDDLELVGAILALPGNQRVGASDRWRTISSQNHAVHFAAQNNNVPLLRLLLEAGFSLSEKNDEGKTALDLLRDKEPVLALLRAAPDEALQRALKANDLLPPKPPSA